MIDDKHLAGDIVAFKQYMQVTSANLQAIKADLQAVTASAQIFKMDYSVFKYDERGLTFMGRPIGPQGPSVKDQIAEAKKDVMDEIRRTDQRIIKETDQVRTRLLGDIDLAKRALTTDFKHAGLMLETKLGNDLEIEVQRARTTAKADSTAAHERADAAFRKAVIAGRTADAATEQAKKDVEALRGEAGRTSGAIQTLLARIERIDEAMK